MVAIACQRNFPGIPATVEVLSCRITTGDVVKTGNGVADSGGIVSIGIKGNNGACLQRCAEIQTEYRPLAALTGDLQGIFATVFRCCNAQIAIQHSLKNGIAPCVFATNRSKQVGITLDFKVNTLQQIALGFFRQLRNHIIDIHCTGGAGNKACAIVVPEQIEMICCLRQGYGQFCPLVAGELHSSLSAFTKLENTQIVLILSLNRAVCHKGNLRAGRQGFTEIHTEGGPVEAIVAQTHHVASAILQRRNLCFIIGKPFNDCVMILYVLSHKVTYIADNLEIQALIEIANRFNGGLSGRCNQIINVNLCGGSFRCDLGTVVVPEHINILSINRQLHLQLCPPVAGELVRGFAKAVAIFEDALVIVAGTIGNPCISLEGDDRTLGKLLSKMNAEDRPVEVFVAQFQCIFTTICKSGNIQIRIGNSFNGGIRLLCAFQLQTGKQSGISGDFKVQAFPKIALRLNRRNGVGCDDVININFTGYSTGGNTGTVIVPEQIQACRICSQRNGHFLPLFAVKLHRCVAAAGKFKNTLVVQALSVNQAVGHKREFCTGRQFLTEVDPEGGPIMMGMTDSKSILTAVFQRCNIQILIGYSCDGGIGICSALAGEHQLCTGSFKVDTLMEVELGDNRAFSLTVEVTPQIIEIQLVHDIFAALLVVQELNSHIPDAGKVIDREAAHHRQVIRTGCPAVGLQGKGLLHGADEITVTLTGKKVDVDLQFFILGIVYVHRNVFEVGKIAGCAYCIQKIQLKIRMIVRLIIEALGIDL